MACVPVLVGCEITGEREIFTWLLLIALLSDILDGLIARTFRMRTDVGAFLDSTADMMLTLVAIAGLFVFTRPILNAHAWGLGIVIGSYGVALAFALLKYRQLAGLHTYLGRTAAYAQGICIDACPRGGGTGYDDIPRMPSNHDLTSDFGVYWRFSGYGQDIY